MIIYNNFRERKLLEMWHFLVRILDKNSYHKLLKIDIEMEKFFYNKLFEKEI